MRVLTFLFSDLVGSTETLARLGESRAEALRRTYFGLLRAAIASSGGREVKSLGDGVMVVFDSPSDAVACSVAMQGAFQRHNARGGERLDVRIGLHVGEAMEGDEQFERDDYFGGPVVEARRLCDAALGGQILVSHLVQALAGARSAFSFNPVGLLALQGLPEPVAAFEVVHDVGRRLQLPLPPELAARPAVTSEFVGRIGERERLRRLWRRAEIGERQFAFVAGEPGIGKTRLVAEFAREVHGEGAAVLWGRSFEEALMPYQPFVQALRHYVVSCGPDELRRRLPPEAGPLVRLLPELQARAPVTGLPASEDLESERYRLFEALGSLLIEISADLPLLLVFDDVQWADRGTLLLLKSIALDPRPASLLAVGTYRDSEVTRSHPLAQLRADVQRDREVELIELPGLAETEVATLVDSLLGFAVPPEVSDDLWSETAGNPFFLEEVVRHLEQLGVASDPDRLRRVRAMVEDLGVPRRVKELVARRLQRLSGAALEALSVGSVIGSEFRLDVLARVLDEEEERLVARMDEAVQAQLLTEVPGRIGEYGFSHALIQQALYEEQTVTRRASLHGRIAESIEALYPDAAAALAYHFSRTGDRSPAKVVTYGRAAGARALELLAYEDAVHELSRALTALGPVESSNIEQRADLLVLLGTAQTRAGDTPAARRSFAEAADLAMRAGAAITLAHAALGYGGGAGFGGVWDRFARVDKVLVGFLEDALAAVPEQDEALRIRLLGRLAEALYWAPDKQRMLALSEQALELARRLDDPVALASALDSRHVALWEPDNLEELRQLADEMLDFGEQLADRDVQLEAHAWLITDALELDPIEVVDRYIAAHARLAEELQQPYHLWYTDATRAMRAHLDGRFAEAAQLATKAWKRGETAHTDNAQQTYLVQLLLVALDTDDVEEMVGGLEQHAAQSPLPAWRAALALAYAGVERRDEALAQVAHFARDDFAAVRRDCIWMATLGLLARTVASFDAAEYAPPLYALLLPFADRNCVVGGGVLCLGPISRFLGMLARVTGDHERALQHLRHALARSRALGSRPLVARTQLDTARVLLARAAEGDAAHARELLADTERIAIELGMTKLAHHAAASAAAAEPAGLGMPR